MAIDDLQLRRGDSAGSNAVRIPQLNQTSVVNQLPNSPRMQAPQISNDIGRALANVGGALNDASRAAQYGENVDMRISEFEVAQEKDKQTIAAAKAVSESQLSLQSYFQEAAAAAQPGAAGFTKQITEGIDAHIAEAVKDANPFYKQAYERAMLSARQSMIGKAQDYEFTEGLKKEVDDVNQGVEASQKLVYADPSMMEQELGRWGATIDANKRFSPEARRNMKEIVRKQLVWAAGAKAIEGNPAEWNALLNPYSPRSGGAVGAPSTSTPKVNQTVRSYAPIAQAASNATGVDQNVIMAQIQSESGGSVGAVSKAGAQGVSQFMPDTAKRYGVDVNSVESSINGQARYMADLLKMFDGDYTKALAGYNWGEGNVQKAIQKHGDNWLAHAPKETRDYVDKVTTLAGMDGDAQVTTAPYDPSAAIPRTGRVTIGEPWYDLATFEEQQQFKRYAEQQFNKLESEANKQRQNIASGLELETRNLTEMVTRGVAPEGQPKTLADFQAAYQNPERASQAYAAYATAWDTASETAKFGQLPSSALVQVVQEKPPAANDTDFAVKSNFQQVRQNAAMRIIEARAKDPWGYAQATGDFDAGVADPSKPEFADVVRRRAAALPQMAEKYGVSNPSVLTQTEAAALGEAMSNMDAGQRINTLKSLRGAISDDGVYASLLNTLRPDSPVTVLAGNIATVGGTINLGGSDVSVDKVASRIARGEDLLNPAKGSKGENGVKSAFPMPKETDMRLAWTDEVKNAYAGFPDAENHAYQAYRAYYAARAAEKGLVDGIADPNIQREAVAAATGGIATIDPNGLGNSYKLILPYGMSQDVFEDKAAALWRRIGPENGYSRTTIDDVRLVPTGQNGRYIVAGPDSLPVPGKDSKPIVLDMLAPVARVSGTIKKAQ